MGRGVVWLVLTSPFWTMAPLHYAAKFIPCLSVDCARVEDDPLTALEHHVVHVQKEWGNSTLVTFIPFTQTLTSVGKQEKRRSASKSMC